MMKAKNGGMSLQAKEGQGCWEIPEAGRQAMKDALVEPSKVAWPC